VALGSRFWATAILYAPRPPRRSGKSGRPRQKGRKRPSPDAVVKKAKRKRFTVSWYGGKTRRVELISGEGHWFKAGNGLVPVRWVFVHDVQGTHRDEYFYCTDPAVPAHQIVSWFTGRWSIEVTFQEVRAHLGFATPRNRTAKSVLRTAPCLLGLFSVISLIFARQAEGKDKKPASTPWYRKAEVSFADALASVRRICWAEVLKQSPKHQGVTKLPGPLRRLLLDQLSRAT